MGKALIILTRSKVVPVIFHILSIFLISSLCSAQGDIEMQNIGRFGGYTGAGALKGNHLFINQGPALTVLDISGENFEKVASLSLDTEPGEIIIHNDHLFGFSTSSINTIQIISLL